MKYSYQTTGTCSKIIELEIEDGILNDVRFTGGCHGNLQGISALVKGRPVKEVIQRLEGIRCKDKPTSCPDQLAKALKSTLIAK